MKDKENSQITCPFCESTRIREITELYVLDPEAPEMEHAKPPVKYKFFRCLHCGQNFDEGNMGKEVYE